MRIYLATTVAGLAGHVQAGVVPGDVVRFVAEDESEEAEYDALCAAGDEAAELLDGPGRRVVIVAEVADPDAAVPISDVVAVHADTGVIDPAVEELPDLGWYATQEIAALLGTED